MEEREQTYGRGSLETIFHEAAELADGERAAYLDRACANQPGIRAEVERLLDAEDRAGGFMQDAATEQPGDLIGPYKLLQVLGEGGMGTVYMAEQTHPVERRVALKIIKPGMGSREVVARFEAERQALAMMEHPSIAKVLDAGATASGRPYFVMELVKGIPITEYCDQEGFDPRRRLELFLHVCRAVHHAHQKGVIHRDLKPANVLVANYDDVAVPKVIDFGVAKATGQKLTEKTMFTQFGQIIGTFEYMSPEQAKLNQLDVDTRADIYSLGVLLYELLTGTTPFERGRLQVVAFDEILRIIREEEPPKPSTRVVTLGDRTAAVSASRGGDIGQLRKNLSGELDWIVMCAMDKDRNRRYASAASLADDIERFLRDEPVHACPPSTGYRVKKFMRRHRRPVIAAVALTLVLLLGLVGTSYGFVEARRAERSAVRVNFRMAFERGRTLCEDGHVAHGLLWLARALELCPDDEPEMERVVRANVTAWHRELHSLDGMFRHDAPVNCVAFSPDGNRIATGSSDHTLRVWDLDEGKPCVGPLRHRGDVHEVAFSHDGARLLSADYDRTAYVWNARTGERLQTLRHGEGRSPRELVILTATGGVLGAAFRPPADSQLVTSCGDGTVAFWDANTGEGLGRLPDVHQHMVHDVAVSSDGKWVLTACHDKNARLWDFDSRELVATLKHDTQVVTAAFRGNDQVVTGDADGNVILWRIQDALAEDDKTLEYSAGQEVAQWHHLGTVHRLRVSADGSRILSASFDNTARLWDPERDVAVGPAFEHQAAVWAVAFSPDGRIATACDDNVVRVWRPAPGQSVREVQHEMGFDHAAIFSPDGRYVLLKIDEEFASVYEAETEARLCTLRHPGGIRAFAVSPDRSRILTGGADGTCRVWDVPGNAPAFDAFRHGNGVWSVAISPDGSRALTGAFDGMVQLTNMRTGKPLRSPLAIGARVQGVAFGPGGSRFGIGGADKRAYIYSTGDENPRVVLRGHHSAVFAISFSRDGTRVATGSHDNTVRVWDTATGRPVSEPLRHPGPICYAVGTALSPDGSTVATACEDGTVRVWDIATSRPIGPALRHPARVLMVAFANDTEIRTGTATGTVRFWDAERTPIRGDVERIKMWVEVITGFELGDDGTLRALDGASWKERRDRLRKLGGPPLRP